MTQTAATNREAIHVAAELDRPTASWVLMDACLLVANRLEVDSSFDLAVTAETKRDLLHSNKRKNESDPAAYDPRCC